MLTVVPADAVSNKNHVDENRDLSKTKLNIKYTIENL